MGILWFRSEELGKHPVDFIGKVEDGDAEFAIESPREDSGERTGYFLSGPTSREFVGDVETLKSVAAEELAAPPPAPTETRSGGGGGGLLLLGVLGLLGWGAYKVFWAEPAPQPQLPPQPYIPGR
jgi:hypothetical protein